MAVVQHMVLLQFKPDVSADRIAEIFSLLAELQQRIPGIRYFSGGPYASDEGMNRGYTHGFLMTFDSAAARDVYLPHPEHERVKAEILPLVDGALAFDFEAPDG